MIELALTAGS